MLSPGVHADAGQVRNWAVRSRQASTLGSTDQAGPVFTACLCLSQASLQALAMAQAASGASGQSLNLSQAGQGTGNSIPGPQVQGEAASTWRLGQLPSSGAGGGGGCPGSCTGELEPWPAAHVVTERSGQHDTRVTLTQAAVRALPTCRPTPLSS